MEGGTELEDILVRLREYGEIYKNIRSDLIKEQLIQSAPSEVLESFAVAAKNILIGNIHLNATEFKVLKQYKGALTSLGFQKQPPKKRRELLSQGDFLQVLSKIMSRLKPEPEHGEKRT